MKCFAGLLVFLPKHSSLSESFLYLQTSMTFSFFFFFLDSCFESIAVGHKTTRKALERTLVNVLPALQVK